MSLSTTRTHLTPEEAEDRYRLPKRTLEGLRRTGRGPVFCKAGRKVLYEISAFEAWLRARTFESTAQARIAGSK
jgi:hypothetical protein